jgi:hypothetical protein
MSLDVTTIRKDFPVLSERINDKPLVYLDSANTSQKPRVVIDALAEFMATQNAPINRSAYHLAAQATERFESTRSKIAAFINAPRAHEIIFTKNATESLNLAILSWGRANLNSGDVVVLTHMEHHANIVPWHMLVAERGIVLRWIPLTSSNSTSPTSMRSFLVPRCCRSPRCRTCSARSIPSSVCAPQHTKSVRSPSWMRANRSRTSQPTCRRGAQTSSRSAHTRCAGHPASASCGAAKTC